MASDLEIAIADIATCRADLWSASEKLADNYAGWLRRIIDQLDDLLDELESGEAATGGGQ